MIGVRVAVVVLAMLAWVPSGTQFIYVRPISCDQTLSVGQDVDAAYAAVTNGVTYTICLNSGTYSTGSHLAFNNVSRTGGMVTIRPAVGATVALRSVTEDNSDFLRFQNLTIRGPLNISGCSKSVELVDVVFEAGFGGLEFTEGSTDCGAQGLLVDGVDFRGVHCSGVSGSAPTLSCGLEGRLSTNGLGLNGLTIRDSLFGSNGYGDGIQIGGGLNVVIETSTFDDVDQDYCSANGGAHCDAIQIFCDNDGDGCAGIIVRRNYCKNSETCIMWPDGSEDAIVEDNVFQGKSTYTEPVQFGLANQLTFQHNTVYCTAESDSCINVDRTSSNSTVKNNIVHQGGFDIECSSCTFTSNLFTNAIYVTGTDNTTGTPTYTGGSPPATCAGWALANGSVGENDANDGNDMGVNNFCN